MPSSEEMTDLSQVKNQVAKLYSCLNIEEHQMEQERQLLLRLDNIQSQLQPMEEVTFQSDLRRLHITEIL